LPYLAFPPAGALFAKAAGDVRHADWAAVSQSLATHGASIEHNMHALREYASAAVGLPTAAPTPTARYVLDTDVATFKHVGLVKLLFPDATVLHVHREDPVATLWDVYRQKGSLHESPTAPLVGGHWHTVNRNYAMTWEDLLR